MGRMVLRFVKLLSVFLSFSKFRIFRFEKFAPLNFGDYADISSGAAEAYYTYTDDTRRLYPTFEHQHTLRLRSVRKDKMKEPEYQSIPSEKDEMRRKTGKYKPRYRPLLTALLLILFIPSMLYHLVPPVSRATDNALTSLTSSLSLLHQTSTHCTKDIGNAQCCTTYLAATPCLDECRKQHVDRETLRLTEAYEGCAERCLGEYDDACTREKDGGEGTVGRDGDKDMKTRLYT
jgi:hypothetical protein